MGVNDRQPLFVAALFVAICSGTAPAPADDYEQLATLLAKPLYPSWEEARAGNSDDAVIGRLAIAGRLLPAQEKVSPELAVITAAAQKKLDACRLTLQRIHDLDAKSPDYSRMFDKALQASPALFRKDEGTEQLLPADQDAVNQLVAKGIAELIKAGINNYQLSEEWNGFRRHYADFGESAVKLAAVAKKRPCLYGIGMVYRHDVDDPSQGMVVSELRAGGSAKSAGLEVGDKIVAVNGEQLVSGGKWNPRALDGLKAGKAGTALKLRIDRKGTSKDFELKRTLRFENLSGLLALTLSGSCDGAFDSDDLEMTNASGVDLTGCTLLVTLSTEAPAEGEKKTYQHLHYVAKWPKGQPLIATYHNGGSLRIARSETCRFLQRVTVELFSDQYQGKEVYDYWNSDDRRSDLEDYCDGYASFQGNFIPEVDGLFTKGDGLNHSNGSVRVWLTSAEGKAAPTLVLSGVTVTVKEGKESATLSWQGFTWRGGGLFPFKDFCSKELNRFRDPDEYEVRLKFYGTDYERVARFTR